MHANVALGRRSDSGRVRRPYSAVRHFALIGALFLIAACDDAGNRTAADFIESGVEHLEAGRAPAAAIQLKNAVQQDPQDPIARLQLARAYLALEALAAAEKELEASIARGDETEETRVLLARTKGNMGKHDEVLRFAETHGEFEGEQASRDFEVVKALSYHAQGVETTAETLLTRVLDDGPHADALAARAHMARQAGQVNEALGHLDEVLEQDPDHVEALLSKGQILLATGAAEESAEVLSRAYELSRHSPRIKLTLANAHTLAGNLDQARELVERLAKVAPRNPQLRYLQAYLALAGEDYQLARTIADDLLGDAPRYAPALSVAGTANLRLNHLELAREHFTKHLAERPDNIGVRLSLAWVMAQQGGDERARELLDFDPTTAGVDLRRAAAIAHAAGANDLGVEFLRVHVAKDPSDARARTQLAEFEIRNGRLAEAIQHMRAVLRQEPDRVSLRLRLAQVLLAMDRPNAAMEELAVVRDDQREDAVFQTLSGLAHLALDERDAATAAFEKALTLAPNATFAAISLASIHQERERPEAAHDVLARALETTPENERLRRALVGLSVARGDVAYATALVQEGLRLAPDSQDLLTLQEQVESGANIEIASSENPLQLAAATLSQIAAADQSTGDQSTGEQPTGGVLPDSVDGWHRLVIGLLQQQRFAEGLAAANRFQQLYPDEPLASNDLALALMSSGQTREAMAAYRRTLDLEPHNETAAMNVAAILTRLDQHSEARDVLRAFTNAAGTTERAQLKLAEVEARLGNRGESERLMREGVTLFPEFLDLKLALGRYYLVTNRAQDALDVLSNEIVRHPSEAVLLETAALAHQALGQQEEAASLFARLAELQGGNVNTRYLAAQAYLQAGQTNQAVTQLAAGLALSPDNLPSRLLLTTTLIDEGQLSQAAAHIEKLLEQAPENAAVAETNGRYQAAVGDLPATAEAFRKAVELDPNSLRVRLLAQALWDTEQQAAAVQTVETWLETTPNDALALVQLATFRLLNNDYAAAKPLLRQLAEAFTRDTNILNNYAVVLLETGEIEEGYAVAERAFREDSENPTLKSTFGRAQVARGETAEGLALLSDAATAAPKNADIQLVYAEALLTAGDEAQAAKVLEDLTSLELTAEQASRADSLKSRLP